MLRAAFEAVSSRVVDPGWDERWRDFHRPVQVGGALDRPALGGRARRVRSQW